jgi:hypothetical protein
MTPAAAEIAARVAQYMDSSGAIAASDAVFCRMP